MGYSARTGAQEAQPCADSSLAGAQTQEHATDDHQSLSNQEARCHDYIKHRSCRLVKVVTDVAGGKGAGNYSPRLTPC